LASGLAPAFFHSGVDTAAGGPTFFSTTLRYSSQFKNNHFTEMCCGTEAGSYLRLIDSCITQLTAQGPSRTCNESEEEEKTAESDHARVLEGVIGLGSVCGDAD